MKTTILNFINNVKAIKNVLIEINSEEYLMSFDELVIFHEFNNFKIGLIDQLLIQYRFETNEDKFQIMLSALIKDLNQISRIFNQYFSTINKMNINSIILNSLSFYSFIEKNDYQNLRKISEKELEINKKIDNVCFYFDENHHEVIIVRKEEEFIKKEYNELKKVYNKSYNQYHKLFRERAEYSGLDFVKSRKLILDCISLIENDYEQNTNFKEYLIDDDICKVGYEILKDFISSEFSLEISRDLFNQKYDENLMINKNMSGKFLYSIKQISQLIPLENWGEKIVINSDANLQTYMKKTDFEIRSELKIEIDKKITKLKEILELKRKL